jgi:hypothetical protein
MYATPLVEGSMVKTYNYLSRGILYTYQRDLTGNSAIRNTDSEMAMYCLWKQKFPSQYILGQKGQ